ncbi:MAG: hypothetical protein GX589_04695 [Deltaproteobacteria bacterium]|nr:hypothetical protein [Deltaproteobacteria bacterium]
MQKRVLRSSLIQPQARLDEAQVAFREWFDAHPQLRRLNIDLIEYNCGGLVLTVCATKRCRTYLCDCLKEKGLKAKWQHLRSGIKCISLLFGYSRLDKRYVVQIVGQPGTAKVFLQTQFEEALATLLQYADNLLT